MKRAKNISTTTQFLNVDLDVYSTSNLQSLITALGKKVFVLHAGRDKRTYSAHLELARDTKNADAAISRFCDLIAALPKAQRDLWDTAKVRDFNIGVQAGMHPHSFEIELEEVTVQAASEIHARIVFTVYAPETGQKRSSRKT